ncbi:LOW QUALITY PROTEIN: Exportin-4 [Plecturocebus cupreus]
MLGRIAVEHCISLLISLLEERVTRLQGQLQQHQQQLLASLGSSTIDNKMLDVIYKDIHWLVLVTVYLLADDTQGETLLIPPELMEYSTKHSFEVDINTTLQILGSPGEKASFIPEYNRTDSVIRLLSAFLRVSEVESQAIRADLTHLPSPQMGKDVFKMLAKDLSPDEKLYDQTSLPFSTVFRAGTECSQWIIGYLLEKVINNLWVWSSEQDLVNDIVQLLSCAEDIDEDSSLRTRLEYIWTQKLNSSIEQWFFSHFSKEVKQEITATLEALCGIAEATQIDNIAILFDFLLDFLTQLH